MTKRTLSCCIEDHIGRDLHKRRCPCGWPKNACEKVWPDIRADELGPPEPGATFDGETWRT